MRNGLSLYKIKITTNIEKIEVWLAIIRITFKMLGETVSVLRFIYMLIELEKYGIYFYFYPIVFF